MSTFEDQGNLSQHFAARVASTQRRLTQDLASEYDYIICGAGTSGSVLAYRLCEDPSVRVLLLEAGGSDESETIEDPNRWVMTLGSESDWGFSAAPNPRLNGRSVSYSMGKILGGGSSINVSTWSRGHKADWDFFARETGDAGWGYDSVLSLYRNRIEDWTGNSDVLRGQGGMVHVQPAPDPHPFADALLAGAESGGLPRFPNQNGMLMESAEGCSFVDETVMAGKRRSIFRSYAYRAMAQGNLTVLTQALVRRIVFEGTKAVGVEAVWNGSTKTFRASHEVVLSQGAIQTPKLLMQSGIGDPAHLKQFGISVLQALPAVGANLHDHISFACIWEGTGEPLPMTPRSQTVGFWKSDPSLTAPNFYTYAIGVPFPTPENAAWAAPPAQGFSMICGMSPQSRGSIRLTGADANAPLTIDAGYLSDPQDMKDLVAGITRAREIGNSTALRPFAKREVHPGPVQGTELENFLRNGLVTFWHQSGTARMGSDESSVVDSQLKVHGIENLRIVDASVLPRVTRGNTMAPCVVIGEKAADFIHQKTTISVTESVLQTA
ncbi:choline dehydrogenase [Granulicella aggregans]|uniref:Choline dehydrogenase n=1 Tax=Granulicella aggregans TaxID=474949 RepID=A0A7W8E6G3_9BACT|nr:MULTISPECIES: GMC family oxidoreductase N-terminal domain-containing protein [Granulicella]MBB5060647.1 choline dehydrogenase [Granulicella aggregans]